MTREKNSDSDINLFDHERIYVSATTPTGISILNELYRDSLPYKEIQL